MKKLIAAMHVLFAKRSKPRKTPGGIKYFEGKQGQFVYLKVIDE